MLSRIAEAFFWIGRYLERAEATARMLSEHHQLLVEDRSVPEGLGCAVLLDALSLPHVDVSDPHGLVHALVGGPDDPSTVAGAVAAARENARGVRDALSGDIFEALNASYLMLTTGEVIESSPGVALHEVMDRLLQVHGVVDWTMPRDEGYLFLRLGRSLERIDMTARLLAVRHDQLWPESGPVATLRSAGALSSFLRTRRPVTGDDVRAFLVLDSALPRSIRRSASDAEEAVRQLDRASNSDVSDLLREVGMLHSVLEFAVQPTSEQVEELAERAQASATRASNEVAHAFFRPAGAVVWSH
ncbi:MAG: alpha-E domain-containing protein [Candidatus Nanopelagicales bacterium]